ncbi:hypothetical protein ACFU6I_03540 [Streptomyces sp. NPDC057486]
MSQHRRTEFRRCDRQQVTRHEEHAMTAGIETIIHPVKGLAG